MHKEMQHTYAFALCSVFLLLERVVLLFNNVNQFSFTIVMGKIWVSNADWVRKKTTATSQIIKLVTHAQTGILLLISFTSWSDRCHERVLLTVREVTDWGIRVTTEMAATSPGGYLPHGRRGSWGCSCRGSHRRRKWRLEKLVALHSETRQVLPQPLRCQLDAWGNWELQGSVLKWWWRFGLEQWLSVHSVCVWER